jgi:hypothetical protein
LKIMNGIKDFMGREITQPTIAGLSQPGPSLP